jgi:hypothetical protein
MTLKYSAGLKLYINLGERTNYIFHFLSNNQQWSSEPSQRLPKSLSYSRRYINEARQKLLIYQGLTIVHFVDK